MNDDNTSFEKLVACICVCTPADWNIENTRLALNTEKFMLRGLERRKREPWRALSVFEPSNINFSVFNANPSILFIPFDFFNVTFNINRSNNLNNNFNSVIKALKI